MKVDLCWTARHADEAYGNCGWNDEGVRIVRPVTDARYCGKRLGVVVDGGKTLWHNQVGTYHAIWMSAKHKVSQKTTVSDVMGQQSLHISMKVHVVQFVFEHNTLIQSYSCGKTLILLGYIHGESGNGIKGAGHRRRAANCVDDRRIAGVGSACG